jgi:hypothetical protein
MRDPWVLLLFLLNPFYIDGVLAFQFPFMWSAFLFFLFVIALDRRRDALACLLLALTVATHPLAGGIGAICYLATHFFAEPGRRVRLFAIGVVAGLASLPAVLIARGTPALAENSARVIISSIADGFVRRATVLAFPFLATWLVVYLRRWYAPLLAIWVVGLAYAIVMVNGAFGYAQGGYQGLWRTSRNIYAEFMATPQFDPRGTYRIMEPNQYEDGQYYFLTRGARLGNEFFSESMFRRSWTEADYRAYLAKKRIDYVAIERGYLAQYHTNEQQLLDTLVGRDAACVLYRDPGERFVLYDVRPFVRTASEPHPPAPSPSPTSRDNFGVSTAMERGSLPVLGLGVALLSLPALDESPLSIAVPTSDEQKRRGDGEGPGVR